MFPDPWRVKGVVHSPNGDNQDVIRDLHSPRGRSLPHQQSGGQSSECNTTTEAPGASGFRTSKAWSWSSGRFLKGLL